MEIRYSVLDPTGNITILVESRVETSRQPEIALKLMQAEPAAEQVGFVWEPDESEGERFGTTSGPVVYLRMAGGEFCGNATMSTAVLYCLRHNMEPGTEKEILVGASGTENPVMVTVQRSESGHFKGTVHMPLPESISLREYEYNGSRYMLPTVRFSGITHIVVEIGESIEEASSQGQTGPVRQLWDGDVAEAAIRKWCAELGADAVGLMLLDNETGCLRPLVYISNPETCIWESSCASGTTAIGTYFAQKAGVPVAFKVTEPGGVLTIEAGDGTDPKLSGYIRILKDAGKDEK